MLWATFRTAPALLASTLLACGNVDGASVASTGSAIEYGDTTFVAMSLNVKWNDGISNTYAERARCMAELVISERVDLLGLQEVRHDMAPEITFWAALSAEARLASRTYGRFVAEMRAEACAPEQDCQAPTCVPKQPCTELDTHREQLPFYWNTARFSLLDGGVHKLDGEASPYPRSLSWILLRDLATGGELIAYNAHVDHFAAGQQHQIATIATLIAAHGAHDARLLLGDFNVDSTTDKGNKKLAPLLQELAFSPANDPRVGTYHNFTGKTKAGAIDYLFHDVTLRVQDASVHDAKWSSCPMFVDNCADHRGLGRLCEDTTRFVTNGYPSDHHPVSARFSYGEQPP